MEIKYEPVFGDQALLEDAGTFTGLDVFTRNIDTGLYGYCRHEDLTYDYLRKNPVLAMRRIIPEPKRWTVKDQKAGMLPEVGSKAVSVRGFCVVDILAVRNGCVVACNSDVIDSRPCVFTIDYFLELYKPIETPEEKEQRLRSEWINKAYVDFHRLGCELEVLQKEQIKQIYDALLSGELTMPGKVDE